MKPGGQRLQLLPILSEGGSAPSGKLRTQGSRRLAWRTKPKRVSSSFPTSTFPCSSLLCPRHSSSTSPAVFVPVFVSTPHLHQNPRTQPGCPSACLRKCTGTGHRTARVPVVSHEEQVQSVITQAAVTGLAETGQQTPSGSRDGQREGRCRVPAGHPGLLHPVF